MAERYRHGISLDTFCTEFGLEETMIGKLSELGFRVGDTMEDVLAISDEEWKAASVSTLAKRRVIAAVKEYWAQKAGQ
jgi:hypothetical protein